MTTSAHSHLEHEDAPWTVAIPDHAGRTESKAFRDAKGTMHKILAEMQGYPFYFAAAGTAAAGGSHA